MKQGLIGWDLENLILKTLTDKDKNDFGMCMSHLACADIPNHPLSDLQLKRMKEAQKALGNIPLTLSASSGIILGKAFHCDMVRVGNLLYGLKRKLYQNIPVVSVSAPVLQVSELKKGESVGYRASFISKENRKIAILGIGFGDGIPRSFSKKGFVCFKGQKAPIIGTLCMDCTVVDVSNFEDISEGDMATIIDSEYPIDKMAEMADMLPSELLSNIGNSKRFIREYF